MPFRIEFDICAIIILLIVDLHFRFKRTIYRRQTVTFLVALWASVSCALTDAISIICMQVMPDEHALNYGLVIYYQVVLHGLLPLFYYHIIICTKKMRERITKPEYCMIIIPYAVDLFLFLSAPINHLSYYFDEAGNYFHGPVFFIHYLTAIYYIIICFVRMFRYNRQLTLTQKGVVWFYSIAIVVGFVVQAIMPEINTISIAAAFTIFYWYLTIENPKDYEAEYLGILNEKAFREVAYGYFDRGIRFKFVAVSVDKLSDYYDLIGLENYNRIIEEICRYLMSVLGKSRVFYSGQRQFMAIIPEKLWDKIPKTIDRVRDRFKMPFTTDDGTSLIVPINFCEFTCPEDAGNVEKVLELGNYALRKAALKGDGVLVSADADLLAQESRESRILQVVKQALNEGLFDVYYQPIYSVRDKKYTSAEALIRLIHPELGFVSPEEFIPVAEKNGLILQIGEYVFKKVCAYINNNRLLDYGVKCIHVNLSPIQCLQEDLYTKFIKIMDEHHLQYSQISLEVTETAGFTSDKMLRTNMEQFILKGVSFALDDYGSGYATMSTITNYPFTMVKIDKFMIWDAFKKPEAMIALKHTIGMLKEMEKVIVVEGVEELNQSESLSKMGVDYLQGYYYSKPVNSADALELFKSNIKAFA